jgi:hypothetical protein
VPADLFLRYGVSPASQSCTPVWLETGVASKAILDVRGVAQVSVKYLIHLLWTIMLPS